MAVPAVATGALRIGRSLTRSAAMFSRGVTSTVSTSNQIIRSSARKIIKDQRTINRENKKQRRFEIAVAEEVERRQRGMTAGATAVISPVKQLVNNVIKKPLESLWNIILGWALFNAPRIIKEVKIFTMKVRVFVAAIKSAVVSIGNVFGSLLKVGKAFVQNILEFDFTDKSKRLEQARLELDDNLESITTSVEELWNVWQRDEKQLESILKDLDSGKNLQQSLDYIFDGVSPDGSPQPQTPVVGPGSGGPSDSSGLSRNARALLNTISFAEGTSGPEGYNMWFGGRTDMDLSKMTINEVVAEQKRRIDSGEATYGRYTSAAVGRYQMMKPEEAAIAAGLDPAVDKFTPENQDRMVIAKYLKGQAGLTQEQIDSDITPQVIDQLAPVFASFPNLFGPDEKGRTGTNTSYYGQGGKSQEQITSYYGQNLGSMPEAESQPTAVDFSQLPTTIDDEFKGGSSSSRIEVTSEYGMRDHPILGRRKMHKGIDIAPPGPGYSVALRIPGKVTRVSNDARGYGNFVIITSSKTGMSYMFAHLARSYVRVGENYNGQPIGEIGATGMGTGIHLHFEVYKGDKDGPEVNPRPYIKYLSIGKRKTTTSSSNTEMRGNSQEVAQSNSETISSRRTTGGRKTSDIVIVNQPIIVK